MARKRGQGKGVTPERLDRIVRALELRRAGADYRTIADKLGVSHTQAHKDVQDALRVIPRDAAEDVLALELQRLDELYLMALAAARKGNLRGVEAALKVMSRRAKYLGLDESRDDGVDAVKTLLDKLMDEPERD